MAPGLGKLKAFKEIQSDDKELIKITAIIDSMTPKERCSYRIIDGRRRKRIASGSGTTVQDVNRLLKKYGDIKKMISGLSPNNSLKSLARNFPF
jgi:signal recognition particle subunit SRP54